MNFSMWRKALTVIPDVSKEEWDALDIISKWLISTCAAVLIMTFSRPSWRVFLPCMIIKK